MNREDIVRMAREADIHVSENNSFADDMYISTLYRFANVVAAAEREACAKLVWATPEPDDVAISHREAIVKAIRARGQE
jgi:hypothetical protein